MKQSMTMAGLFCLMLALAAPALARDRFLLVKVTDWTGSTTYTVMSPDEFKAAESELALERRFSSRALMMAQKEWRNDAELGRKTFPRSAGNPPDLRVVREYGERSEADQKASELMDRITLKAKEEATAESNRKRGRPKEQNARDNERETEKTRLVEKGRTLYEAALATLKAELDAAAQPAP